MATPEKTRCPWAITDLAIDYHDREWGVPVYDDQVHFEFLVLEAAQAGLSWNTVLNKRGHYRKAFHNFVPEAVARFGDAELETLLQNPGLIRNRLKLSAAIHNARMFLEVQEAFGSFSNYIWRFVEGRPIRNAWRYREEVPVTSAESDALSRDLKRRGFKFVGSTICYAHLQATGLVNAHLISCFRYSELAGQPSG
jgi:DNA-3-methyladenine glycosylase I